MPDTEKLVTLERLKELLAAYGASPGLWPSDERAATQALIDTSSEARSLYDKEQALDTILQQVTEPEVSAALRGRVRSMTPPSGPVPAAYRLTGMLSWMRPQSPRAWQGAIAVAGILGIVTGVGISTIVINASPPATGTVVMVGNDTAPDATNVTVLTTPNTSNAPLSLTGQVVTETDRTGEEADDGEGSFTVAGIPLY
jgi:hypothetical protein